MTQRSREKPRRTAFTRSGQPCKGTAVAGENGRLLCAIHAGKLGDPAELGRKGGKARGKRKGKAGSFLEALRRTLERDPEKHAQRLLDSGAAGMRLASELLEAEERAKAQETAGPLVIEGHRIVSFDDIVALAYRTGQAHLFGCPTTVAELERLLATEGEGVAAEVDEDSPYRESDASKAVPVDEQRLPKVAVDEKRLPKIDEEESEPIVETDDLVVVEDREPAP